jgi:hypothetical protein
MKPRAKTSAVVMLEAESEPGQLTPNQDRVVVSRPESEQLKSKTGQPWQELDSKSLEGIASVTEHDTAVVMSFSVSEAADLARVSRQAVLKSITEGRLEAEPIVATEGHRKGRSGYQIPALALFALYPQAEQFYQIRQSAEAVGRRMAEADALRASQREKLLAENPSTSDRGSAKAWHLNRFRQFAGECGHGKKRALNPARSGPLRRARAWRNAPTWAPRPGRSLWVPQRRAPGSSSTTT